MSDFNQYKPKIILAYIFGTEEKRLQSREQKIDCNDIP